MKIYRLFKLTTHLNNLGRSSPTFRIAVKQNLFSLLDSLYQIDTYYSYYINEKMLFNRFKSRRTAPKEGKTNKVT